MDKQPILICPTCGIEYFLETETEYSPSELEGAICKKCFGMDVVVAVLSGLILWLITGANKP